MKKSKVKVIRLGTDYMNDEQRLKFYEIMGKSIKKYEEQLEKYRIERLRAMQDAHYICRNYYRLSLDRR